MRRGHETLKEIHAAGDCGIKGSRSCRSTTAVDAWLLTRIMRSNGTPAAYAAEIPPLRKERGV
jgi:hypothetical protein